jgi:hypothetical protein
MKSASTLLKSAPMRTDHFVQFYDSDEQLVSEVASFSADALRDGGSAIVIARPERLAAVYARLGTLERASGSAARDRVFMSSAQALLDSFMDGDLPDPALSPLDRHHRRSGRARGPAGTRVRRNGRAAVRAASLRGCAAARSAVERVDRAIPLLAVLRLSARRVSSAEQSEMFRHVCAAPAHPAFGVAAQRREPAASDARAVPATGARSPTRSAAARMPSSNATAC